MINIYEMTSKKITSFYIKKGTISPEKKPLYEYGFEILFSTIIYTALLLIIALITNTLFASVVFFIGFYIVRTIAGGYHANTYTACHILFLITHLIMILIYKITPYTARLPIAISMLVLSSIIMLLFAPIDHINKPFINEEKKRFRRICRIYSLLLIFISFFNLVLPCRFIVNYLLSFALGTFPAAISLVSAIIIEKKGEKSNETL